MGFQEAPFSDLVDLPESVTNKIEMMPVEDLALAVLRKAMPDVQINTWIEFDQTEMANDFFILVRRISEWGLWDGDDRFIDYAGLSVHVFCKDPDGDLKGALISEAVRVAFRDSAVKREWFPGLGGFLSVRLDDSPARKTDWATSTGPVQFADLPSGYMRYEARYSVWVRRP